MPNVLNTNFDYTYPGQLATDIFYKPAVQFPDLTRIFRVITNVPYKRQLNTLVPLGKILQGAQGCGTINDTASGINIVNQTLETCPGEFRVSQCADTFEQTVLDEDQPTGIGWYDLLDSPLGRAAQRVVLESFARDIFRVMSFGDTTSPAGDPSYYGWCDGLWTRLIDGASSYEVTAVNSNITALNQTAGTRALDYLRGLFEGAPIILKQLEMSRKRFFVTGIVWENLLQTYQDSAINNGGLTQQTENGMTTLRFNGIEVVPVYAWDSWIQADNLGNNVRLLYTTPENHIIGLNSPDQNTSVSQWYEKIQRKVYWEGRFHVGYQYIHGDLQAISYGNV